MTIHVAADHVPGPSRGKRALLAVRFRGVRRFDWTFRHHEFDKFPLTTSKDQHLEWNIYEFEIIQHRLTEVNLSGSEQFAVLKIEFEDVDIESVPHAMFVAVNPGAFKPGKGMARPGIEHFHSLTKRT